MDEEEYTMGCASSQSSQTGSLHSSDPNGTIDSGVDIAGCVATTPTVNDNVHFQFSECQVPKGDNHEDMECTPIYATAEASSPRLKGNDNSRCYSVDDINADCFLAEIDEIHQSGASNHLFFGQGDDQDSSRDINLLNTWLEEIRQSDLSKDCSPGEVVTTKICQASHDYPLSHPDSALDTSLKPPSGMLPCNLDSEHVPLSSADDIDTAKDVRTSENSSYLDQGVLRLPEDSSSNADKESVNDRYRVLSPEERGALADLYKMLWSEMERDKIKSKLLDHKELLDVEITLWTSDRCTCTMARFFEEHKLHVDSSHVSQDKDQEESIHVQEYAFLIREGLCYCHQCTTNAMTVRASSCLFRIAVSVGKVWLIEFLLDQGCLPNSVSLWFHYTPLHLAILRSNQDIVKLLVQRAPDKLSQPTPESGTWLHLIVELLRDDSVKLLDIVLGGLKCDLNALNGLRETALGLAVRSEQLKVVQRLLENGADPNILSEGVTPLLHLAVQDDNKEMALALIKGGADVNAFLQSEGETALHISIYSASASTDFNHAAQIEMTRLLLENGADPNLKTHHGDPPLVIAAEENWPKLVGLLISYGAEVNGVDVSGFNALHNAAWAGHIHTVNVLLASGAEPDSLTSCKNTPLSLAAHGNALNCLNALLKYKVNVDNADKDLDTPLHYLAFNGNAEGIQALLDHGANPDVLNSCNASPLWNAIYMRHSEVICLLVMQNVSLDVKSCGNDQFRYDGTNAVPLYDEPHSLLWVAAERQWLDSVTILLQAGYNIWKEGWLLSGEDQGLPEESLAISRHLRALAQTPPSLLSLCGEITRKAVSSDLEKTVQQFPIPVTLKDYLLLKDLKLQDSVTRVSLWDFKYDP